MSRNSALTARARRYLADALHAFEHAPVEVTLSVAMAAAFSYAVASDADPFREWFELAMVMMLAGAVAFIATLLHALGAWSERARWAVTAGGTVVAALYGVFVLDLRFVAEAWRAGALVVAAVLLLLAAPALGGGSGATARFRRVTGRVVLRTLAVLLYAAALYAGLALALGAINTLFELDLDARIYAHVFGWVFFVLVTWVIVGGVPDYVRPEGDTGPVAAAVHRISAFLVTPLLALYYMILYAYAVRIAITGELPKNLVSPLVIVAGLIAGVALVLFDRRRTEAGAVDAETAAGTTERGVVDAATDTGTMEAGGVEAATSTGMMASASGRGAFGPLRIVVPLFVPLCVLGVWALSLRLGQYGWTEFRGLRVVLLLTLGGLALAAVVRVIRGRSLPLYVLPLTLSIVAVLSVAGPWSVIAGSRRSQQARLAEAMSAAGIEWDATNVRDTLIANEPHREISETARYLASHFGAGALPPLFARHVTRERHVDVVYAAGLRPAHIETATLRAGYGQLESGALLDEGRGGAMYYVRLNLPVMRVHPSARPPTRVQNRPASPGTTPATADSAFLRALADSAADSLRVRIPVAGTMLIADLESVGRSLLSEPPGRGLSPALARVALYDEGGRERGELFVLELGLGGDQHVRVHQLVGIVRLAPGTVAR